MRRHYLSSRKRHQQALFIGARLSIVRASSPSSARSGCAFGVDRILMELLNEENVREVLAFPKNGSGLDVMMSSPSAVEPGQLRELGL